MNSHKKIARIAGFLYLMFIIASFVTDRFGCFTPGDPPAIVKKIMANEWLFRIGFISNLLSAVLFLLAAWALYVLLKPVNNTLALLFLLLNLGGVAIQCMSALSQFAALLLLSGAEYLNVFQAEQLQAQAMFFIHVYNNGFLSAQIFFGLWLLPLGYLVFKSGFLPKFLGILLMIDCFAILIWFFQFFLFPDYETISIPCVLESLIAAEVGLCLWLIIKGVITVNRSD
jgi:hypothetical protein